MAQKFVRLDEAAKQLGISIDRLNALRESGKARAFRDGAGWKFKEEEVQRIAEEGVSAAAEEGSDVELAHDDLELQLEDSESILLSEVELGEGESSSSSTIIGKDEGGGGGESDLEFSAGSKPAGGQNDSDLELSDDSKPSGDESKVVLELEGDLELDDSSVELDVDGSHVFSEDPGGSGVLEQGDGDPGSKFEDLDVLDVDLETEASQIGLGSRSAVDLSPPTAGKEAEPEDAEPSELGLQGDSSLEIADSGEQQVTSSSDKETAPESSSRVGAGGGESSLTLADDDDDDLILGEGSSSDITLARDQTGIQLVDTSDEGISLDDVPLEIGDSAIESIPSDSNDAFTLAEDSAATSAVASQPEAAVEDNAVEDNAVADNAVADSAVADSAVADNAVEDNAVADNAVADSAVADSAVLTPAEAGEAKTAADGGSQVVALDLEEAEFDETGATMLGGESALGSSLDLGSAPSQSGLGSQLDLGPESAPAMLDEDAGESAVPPAPVPAPAPLPAPAVVSVQYSVWNIVFLTGCCILLLLCGVMLFDLMRSIWSWNEPYGLNSALMDALINTFL